MLMLTLSCCWWKWCLMVHSSLFVIHDDILIFWCVLTVHSLTCSFEHFSDISSVCITSDTLPFICSIGVSVWLYCDPFYKCEAFSLLSMWLFNVYPRKKESNVARHLKLYRPIQWLQSYLAHAASVRRGGSRLHRLASALGGPAAVATSLP